MKKTAAAGGAAGGALDPSPPELRARYDSLTKKYRFLKKVGPPTLSASLTRSLRNT